jgi:hypothetical protein
MKLSQATKEAKAPIGAGSPPPTPPDAANAPTMILSQATKEAKAPIGVVQPPKKETGKVQPKKETVRINLPPKPTAAPTIKLPTLPPGGPTGAPTAAGVAAPASAPGNRLATATPTGAAKPAATAAPTTQQRPATMPQRSVAAAAPAIKTVDKILIFAAAFTSLVAVGGAVWVLLTIKNLVETFTS